MDIRNKVQSIISDELAKSSVTTDWTMDEIHVLPGSGAVIEYTSSSGALSQALINHYFPPITGKSRQAHFTTLDNFKSVLNSKSLRLYSLLKRVNEQEFEPFSEDFGLSGYLDESQGEPYYKSLMGDLFYTSFTNIIPTDESYLWSVFGGSGTGVKIVFDISVIKSCSELRPVIYGTKNQAAGSLIKKLNDRIESECGRHFIMRGISRIGAFYLPLGYNLEKEEETRLLIKSWGEGPAHELIEHDGRYSYIPLKLGDDKNEFCDLKIAEVQVGKNCSKDIVEKLLENSGLSNVLVSHA
jgi:hypothetical protein